MIGLGWFGLTGGSGVLGRDLDRPFRHRLHGSVGGSTGFRPVDPQAGSLCYFGLSGYPLMFSVTISEPRTRKSSSFFGSTDITHDT